MFVSSFNTYISTNQPQKTQRDNTPKVKSTDESFSKYLDSPVIESKNTKNIPISYISNYKAFNNKQKLENQFKNPDGEKFSKINSQKNMQTAYDDNSKVFSLYLQPQQTLNQTPSIDNTLAPEVREIKEYNQRQNMLSAYAANNNYYLVTA